MEVMLLAKRLKLKKKVLHIGIVAITILLIGSFLGIKSYKEFRYKQSYEYKLIEHGYSLEDAQTLLKFYKQESDLNHLLEIDKNTLILEFIKEKYFIHKNLDRYLTYAKKNKDTSNKDIVALVNVNRDYDFYEEIIESDSSKGNLVNVNKYYTLSENFEPENIKKISVQYSYAGNSITEEANDAYISMWKAAYQEGYKLIVNSSYRSYQSQEEVYNNIKNAKGTKEADKVAARPGHSEHQTGLAIDVFEINNQSTSTFKDSPAYTWLKENAYKFGFIERYPEEKEYLTGYSFEAWHWRYVGEEVAKVIHQENITFDEYYAYYIENQA